MQDSLNGFLTRISNVYIDTDKVKYQDILKATLTRTFLDYDGEGYLRETEGF